MFYHILGVMGGGRGVRSQHGAVRKACSTHDLGLSEVRGWFVKARTGRRDCGKRVML